MAEVALQADQQRGGAGGQGDGHAGALLGFDATTGYGAKDGLTEGGDAVPVVGGAVVAVEEVQPR
ncbi:hypothetical protein [Microbispora sp. CA-102843]|uniref:hypothetical protein n=1 Tax=Microbispora sp. CA-102843 TaxID=3239952 RepID=UPI003D930BDD